MTLSRITVEVVGEQFHALTDDDGAVIAATFGDAPDWDAEPATDHPVAVALRRYAAGDLGALDEIAVAQTGTPFRAAVWDTLRTIPPGRTITYTDLAALSGRPSAVRAAASGCATNRVPLIVPCHRVVRGDGTLGGYAFGLPLKARLLAHEAAFAAG